MTLEELNTLRVSDKVTLLKELEIVEYTVDIMIAERKLQLSGIALLPYLTLQYDLECLFVGRHKAEKIMKYEYFIRSRGTGPIQVNCNRLGSGADIPVPTSSTGSVGKTVQEPSKISKRIKRIK